MFEAAHRNASPGGTKIGAALRRWPRASPHDFDFVALKVCFFWQTAGSPVYCVPVYCEHVGAESNRNVIATPKSDGAPFLDVLTRSLEHKRAARGDFSGDIDRLAVVLACCRQIGHDLVNQASCLGVVHPECGLELIGKGRRKSFSNPRIRTIQAGN